MAPSRPKITGLTGIVPSGLTPQPAQRIELRSYVFLDSLQPQLAAYAGTVSGGFLPIPGDTCLWLEVVLVLPVHHQLMDETKSR